MLKLLGSYKRFQLLKRSMAWLVAVILVIQGTLSLQAATQVDTFNEGRVNWSSPDMVIPYGQEYADLVITLDWGTTEQRPINATMLTMRFPAGALTSGHLLNPPVNPVLIEGVEPNGGFITSNNPFVLGDFSLQSYNVNNLGGFGMQGYMGGVVLGIRMNINEGFLVNPGDYLIIDLGLAAILDLPADNVPMRLTRGAPEFDIVYEGNPQDGGTVGGMPANQEGLAAGNHQIRTEQPTHSDVNYEGGTREVMFVGWSTQPQAHIFAAGESSQLPAGWINPRVTPTPEVTITDASVTLHAIWGWATDPAEGPDVLRDVYSINYLGNAQQGGTVAPASLPPAQNNLLSGTHALGLEIPTHTPVERDNVLTHVVFHGWSATATTEIFAPEAAPATVTSVTITDADVDVHAVWVWGTCVECPECPSCEDCFICDNLEACDCDSGLCVDCCEECTDPETFTITYRPNPQHNGTVSGLPENQTGLEAGSHTLRTGIPTHSHEDRDGVPTHVVFHGWSTTATTEIFAPGAAPATVTSVTIADANVNVYAVWVWGTCVECPECPSCEDCFICDNLEECDCDSGLCVDCCEECTDPETFTITYRSNPQQGGTVSNLPENQTGLEAGSHTLRTGIPTHSPVNRNGVPTHVVFHGWSTAMTTDIFAPEAAPATVTSVTIADTNVNVYAVWVWGTCVECPECPSCEDCFICDNLEECDCDSGLCVDCCDECEELATFTITYRPNPQQGGTVSSLPENQTGLEAGSHTLRTGTPTHSPVNRNGVPTHVVFHGWSIAPANMIFEAPAARAAGAPGAAMPFPNIVTSVTITDANVNVYAVWVWGTCVECPKCPGCEDCFICDNLEECECDSGYCADCCEECEEPEPATFTITYRPNPQQNGTVSNLPENQAGLEAGSHTLRTGTPTHTSVNRDGVPTHVVFRGWSATPTNQIFAVGAAPTVIASVTITDANVNVYAVWVWGTCVECTECPGCEECFHCGDKEECDCESGYCKECCEKCDECDCTFECKECEECCDVEECDCESGYCAECCEECDDPATFTITYRANPQQNGTVSRLPENQTGLEAGNHTLRTGVPTHTAVTRNGVATNVVFRGWSATPTNQIFETGATLPTLLTSVTITNANVNVYAVWGWGAPVSQPPANNNVPKTGDAANMVLWVMMFALGLLGFAATSTKYVMGRRQTAKPNLIVIVDENGEEQFIMR